MPVKLYQQGRHSWRMLERDESYVYSDIIKINTDRSRWELSKILIEISDRHGSLLPLEHSFFAGHAFLRMKMSGKEVHRCKTRMREMRSIGARAMLMRRYKCLNSYINGLCSSLMTESSEIRNEDITRTHARTVVLQGCAVVGKTCTIRLFRDMALSSGLRTEITAANGIYSVLYDGGSTFHSLLGLVFDDMENDESSNRTSKYGLQYIIRAWNFLGHSLFLYWMNNL